MNIWSVLKSFLNINYLVNVNFFSSLKDEGYLLVINVLNVFKMNTTSDIYLKTDVLLLADVSKNFINVCLEYYELDPCHYFISCRLSSDVMLKMTKIEL